MQVSLSSNFSRFSPNDSSGSSAAPAQQAEVPAALNPEEAAPSPKAERSPSAEAGSTDDALIEEAIALYTPVPPQASADSAAMRRNLSRMLTWAKGLEQSGGRDLANVRILGTGMRSVVVRVNFKTSDPAEAAEALPSSLILKRYRRKDSTQNAGGFGYLRERYGLPALNEQVPGLFPRFYGADAELRVIALRGPRIAQYSAAHRGGALLPLPPRGAALLHQASARSRAVQAQPRTRLHDVLGRFFAAERAHRPGRGRTGAHRGR